MIKVYKDIDGRLSYVYKDICFPFWHTEVDRTIINQISNDEECYIGGHVSEYAALFPNGLQNSLLVAEWSPDTGIKYVGDSE